MLAWLKQRLHRFLQAPRGMRFRAYHERLRQRPNRLRWLLGIGGGLVLLALGLAMLVLPGPGLLVASVGLALLAGRSLTLARLLDRLDLRVARAWKRWHA